MRNITIIRRSFLSVSVMATILSSMGLCWQSNLDCQYGKWLACAIVFFSTFIALFGDKINENKCLCFLIFILIGCLISDIHANSVSLSNLTWGFALLSFFVLCQGITSKGWIGIVITCNLIVLALIILQAIGVYMPFQLQLFDNPAGKASALVMGVCCILPNVSFNNLGKQRLPIIIMVLFACVVLLSGILLYHCSRTGFIALCLSISIYLICLVRHKLSRWQWMLIAIATFLTFSILASQLYLRNPDSVKGRFLTYQVNALMIADHPWLGWGSNAINAHYMVAQAKFLQTLAHNHIYNTLAGDIVRPFNEVLNWVMCYGIINLMLVIVSFFSIWKSLTSCQKVKILPAIAAWFTLGISSYPSYYPYACFLLAGSLGNIFHSETGSLRIQKSSIARYKKYIILAVLLICTLIASMQVYKANAKDAWMGKNMAEDEFHPSIDTNSLPPCLTDDIDVLYTLSVNLNLEGEPQKSQEVLDKLKGHLQNYDTELLAGDNALSLHQWDAAEKHFLLAHHMVPARFMPLYGQMQVYLEHGDLLRARSVALKITRKKAKIDSEDIHDIKAKARKVLKAGD